MQRQVAEQTGKEGGNRNAESGEQRGFCRNRPGSLPFCAETAVKHNKNQRNGAELFRYCVIVKRNFKQSVRAEYHAQGHKAQKGGHTEFIGKAVCDDTGEDDGAA